MKSVFKQRESLQARWERLLNAFLAHDGLVRELVSRTKAANLDVGIMTLSGIRRHNKVA